MATQRGQIKIKPDFVDIRETLKRQIGNTTDDDYIGAQSGTSNTIAVGKTTEKISFDDFYITLDTRSATTLNNANGQFQFDLGPYMQQTNTLLYELDNVIEITITEPFFIPKLTINETFIFERVLLTIKEVTSSFGSSATAAPPFHFSLIVSDTGLGRFQLTPIRDTYYIRRPIRLAVMTLQFSTPVSFSNTIPFPPTSLTITYNSTAAFTTTFDNAANAGFVVGDVMYFSSSDPGIQSNPANADFFRPTGHTITATIPLQVTISGAYTILDGANLPVPVGTPFNVTLASRIIRVPFKIKAARTGDGNFITAIST
jgi:hypothetical protein